MKQKIIFTLLTIVWMGVIFYLSANDADDSTEMSHSVGRVVAKVVVPEYENWTEEKQTEFVMKIDHPVRKAAHATEYAILGFLLFFTFGSYGVRGTKRTIFSILGAALYSCTDEFHQLYVSGRSGQIQDVLIDSVGATAGVIFAMFIVFLYGKAINKNKKEATKENLS